jgi:hypothetical protein
MRKEEQKKIVIRRALVERWVGINAAARALGVSHAQVRRHVSGASPSRSLARRMEERGVELAGKVGAL